MILEEHIDFVKSQIDHHTRTIDFHRKRHDKDKERRHIGILRRFNELLPILEDIITTPLEIISPIIDDKKVGNRLGDLSDLPEEIRAQLVSVQFDETESLILKVIKSSLNGIATIDEIFVGMFRETGEVLQREALAQKIYRMTRKELLFSVEGRKGVYSVQKVPSEEVVERES